MSTALTGRPLCLESRRHDRRRQARLDQRPGQIYWFDRQHIAGHIAHDDDRDDNRRNRDGTPCGTSPDSVKICQHGGRDGKAANHGVGHIVPFSGQGFSSQNDFLWIAESIRKNNEGSLIGRRVVGVTVSQTPPLRGALAEECLHSLTEILAEVAKQDQILVCISRVPSAQTA